jgi:hypothetical protein
LVLFLFSNFSVSTSSFKHFFSFIAVDERTDTFYIFGLIPLLTFSNYYAWGNWGDGGRERRRGLGRRRENGMGCGGDMEMREGKGGRPVYSIRFCV